MKKQLSVLSGVVLGTILLTTPVYGAPICSDWALPYVEEARAMALIPTETFYTQDLSEPLTRYDMASLLTQIYNSEHTMTYFPDASNPGFTDIPSWTVDGNRLSWSTWGYEAKNLFFPVDTGIMGGTSETTFSPAGSLTRQEFAKIMMEMLAYQEGEDLDLDIALTADFTDFDQVADWAKPYVVLAVKEGMISGYEDGRFGPTDLVTWEQVFRVMIEAFPQETGEIPVLTSHTEGTIISSEEALVITSHLSEGYTGYIITDDGNFYSSSYVEENGGAQFATRYLVSGEAYTLFVEADGRLSDPVTVYVDQQLSKVTTEIDSETNMVTITIDRVVPGTYFNLQVIENRATASGYLIEPREKLSVALLDAQSYTFQGDCNRNYEITLTSWDETQVLNLYSGGVKQDPDLVAALYEAGAYADETTAAAAMVAVEIPVWRLSNGVKTASTATIWVNPILADTFLTVFTEIFNGPEQFPISTVGAYSWRGTDGSGTHNAGIAVDINADANMCVYASGETVGSYWSPYEDPYSITPYGDVVRAFENNGFIWGGDAWGGASPQDYMHFNYLNGL